MSFPQAQSDMSEGAQSPSGLDRWIGGWGCDAPPTYDGAMAFSCASQL